MLGGKLEWNSEVVSPPHELDDPVVLALLRALLQNNAARASVNGGKAHRHVIDANAIFSCQPFKTLAPEVSPIRQNREVVVDHHFRRSSSSFARSPPTWRSRRSTST